MEIYGTLTSPFHHSLNEIPNPTQLDEIQTQVYHAIVSGEEHSVQKLVDIYVSQLRDMALSEAKLKALSLVMALNKTAEQEFHTAEIDHLPAPCLKQLHHFKEFQQIIEWTHEFMDQFLNQWEAWRSSNSAKNPIELAIEYMNQHYMERCSLNEMAAYVYLHPNYFSNLFKKETWESFIAYLTKIRVGKAKMLLTNTNMKITSIAESVGYDEPTYFTNLFKQHFGMSPSVFRKKCSVSGNPN